MEPYIDAHSHIWTPDLLHYPLAAGFKASDMQPRSFTAQELLATCRPAGVGRVNLIQMSFYQFENWYMLDMIKLFPERFVGTAIVDPLGADPGRAMRELALRGVHAFRIQPQYSKQPPARWLEPEGYRAMFATAALTGQALSCLIDRDGFAEVDRMCRRFPRTAVIIDHLGRIGAERDGTIRDSDVDALCALAKHDNVYLKVGAFYALGKKTPPYLDLAPLSNVSSRPSARAVACGKAIARFRSSSTVMSIASPWSATTSTSSPRTTATGFFSAQPRRSCSVPSAVGIRQPG